MLRGAITPAGIACRSGRGGRRGKSSAAATTRNGGRWSTRNAPSSGCHRRDRAGPLVTDRELWWWRVLYGALGAGMVAAYVLVVLEGK